MPRNNDIQKQHTLYQSIMGLKYHSLLKGQKLLAEMHDYVYGAENTEGEH